MTERRVDVAARRAHNLDEASEHLRKSAKHKFNVALVLGIAAFVVLFIVGIYGVWKQNQIATKNQQHIDCIVKLFTTPLPASARARTIENPSSTCDIKFTQ